MMLEHRVLITGGAGFIGSHIAEQLLGTGVKVIGLDNFFAGSRRNIDHLLEHPDYAFRRHDVCVPMNLRVDEIYHFASIGSSIPARESAASITSETTETTVTGAANVLKLARRFGAKLFLGSGCEVYDEPVLDGEDGQARTNQPRYLASYGAGRRFAETLCFDQARQYGLNFRIGRIFNTYGPRMPLGGPGSVADFIVRALRGEDLAVPGDGGQMQSLTYVDDVVKTCLRLMDRPRSISGPIDIGSGDEISTLGLAKRIISLVGSASRIVSVPAGFEGPSHRPDLEPGQDVLGWSPSLPLETGLMRTIEYFDGMLRAGALSLHG